MNFTKTSKGTRLHLGQLKARIQLRGLHTLDRRTGAAKELVEWRAGVIAALGGEENVSPMKLTVVEEATRARAYLNHIDQFLLSLESVIDKRSKKLRPIVESRMRIGEHLMKQMDRLGLERVAKPIQSRATARSRTRRSSTRSGQRCRRYRTRCCWASLARTRGGESWLLPR